MVEARKRWTPTVGAVGRGGDATYGTMAFGSGDGVLSPASLAEGARPFTVALVVRRGIDWEAGAGGISGISENAEI